NADHGHVEIDGAKHHFLKQAWLSLACTGAAIAADHVRSDGSDLPGHWYRRAAQHDSADPPDSTLMPPNDNLHPPPRSEATRVANSAAVGLTGARQGWAAVSGDRGGTSQVS